MSSKGILFIDCPEQEKENAFSAGKEISEDEYVRMLREYSKTIGTSRNFSHNNQFRLHEINQNDYEENKNYAKASVNIYNISGNLCDIRELYKIQKNGVGILIFDIIKTEMDDAFESEFKFWKRDSMNINNDECITKDDRIRFLPVKDLQFEIDRHLFLFSGCKLYHEYEDSKIAIIIQSIKEI